MKILSLSEQNVKRLSAVELTLDDKGNLVIVAGNNEQGKSSLLDGIEMALHGGASIPAKPVRRGQDKATVEMTLGEIGLPELTVKRTMTSTGGGALTVTNKDGAKLSSPQAILDALVGKLSFDPLGFVKMKASDRSETLRQLMGLDFSKQEAERDELFGQRTASNRRVKSLEAQLSALPIQSGVPSEVQSTYALMDAQRTAASENQKNEKARSMLSELESRLASLIHNEKAHAKAAAHAEAALQEARRALAVAQADVEKTEQELAQKKAAVSALVDADLSIFSNQLRELEAVNSKVRKNKERETVKAALKIAEKEAQDLTKKIEAINRAKRDAIAAAKFPLPGMSLGDSGEVLLDGLPFEQASTKGQLMASLAMGAALNPKLRVLLVRSGNDLDDASMKVLAEWADANNIQVWLERISTSGKVAVVIEDGRAVESDQNNNQTEKESHVP